MRERERERCSYRNNEHIKDASKDDENNEAKESEGRACGTCGFPPSLPLSLSFSIIF